MNGLQGLELSADQARLAVRTQQVSGFASEKTWRFRFWHAQVRNLISMPKSAAVSVKAELFYPYLLLSVFPQGKSLMFSIG